MQIPWAQPFWQRPCMAGSVSRSPAHTHHGLPGLPSVGACLLQRPETASPGASERNVTIPSSPWHISISDVHIFGMWEEAEVPRENPCWHGENMSTPHRQWPQWESIFFSHQCYKMISLEDLPYLAPNLRTLQLDRRPKNFSIQFRSKLNAFPCQFRHKYNLRLTSSLQHPPIIVFPDGTPWLLSIHNCPLMFDNQPQPYWIWFILIQIKTWLLVVIFS